MSHLRYLCFFVHSGVLCFCFVFLCLVYPMLPVPLDFPLPYSLTVIYYEYIEPPNRRQSNIKHQCFDFELSEESYSGSVSCPVRKV